MQSAWLNSPVGRLRLTSENGALTGLQFPQADVPASEPATSPVPPLLRDAIRQLQAYFAGRLQRFELPLAPAGTPFQEDVWKGLLTIPYGKTLSYGELAARIGRPRSARPVGRANGRNPIAIIIPCHRVIGADGSLTGFGGGLDRKQVLLNLEQTA